MRFAHKEATSTSERLWRRAFSLGCAGLVRLLGGCGSTFLSLGDECGESGIAVEGLEIGILFYPQTVIRRHPVDCLAQKPQGLLGTTGNCGSAGE